MSSLTLHQHIANITKACFFHVRALRHVIYDQTKLWELWPAALSTRGLTTATLSLLACLRQTQVAAEGSEHTGACRTLTWDVWTHQPGTDIGFMYSTASSTALQLWPITFNNLDMNYCAAIVPTCLFSALCFSTPARHYLTSNCCVPHLQTFCCYRLELYTV